MESPEKFVRGSVKISVSGEQIERFKPVPRQRTPSGKCPSPRREETHRPHFHSRFQKAGAHT